MLEFITKLFLELHNDETVHIFLTEYKHLNLDQLWNNAKLG